MSKPIIEINHLSKVYNIGHEQKSAPGTLTFRDSLTQTLRKPVEIFTGHRMDKEKFWALKDINLDIQPGDTIGLIGKNGSGKSTLLKVLSRIVEPTEGEIIMRGRSASLLEVGTGFHPELTGRENIFFNGAILGMSQKEIRSKFDEIIAFSGVEKFLDTPVKFYSSGMYVRLAFAVAAHLEPDILIVDEVLAVGDAEFQKKSLGKMRDVTADKSRTVIFVSHSMEAVRAICNKCVLLSEGSVVSFGPTTRIIDEYNSLRLKGDGMRTPKQMKKSSSKVYVSSVKVTSDLTATKSIEIAFAIANETGRQIHDIKVSVDIVNEEGELVSNMLNSSINKKLDLQKGENNFAIKVNKFCLVPGLYNVNIFVASDNANTEIYDHAEDAATLEVGKYDFYGTGLPPTFDGKSLYLDFEYLR